MPAKVGYLVIDAVDPARLAQFWCGVLDIKVGETIGDDEFLLLTPTEDGLTIGFQRVGEAKAGKNRLHLDLVVEDLDVSTAEIEALGGTWLEPGNTRELEGFFWRCLADPEGNEFDIDVLPTDA
jgi:predicted enzyme related to lactoylglutathione lyase